MGQEREHARVRPRVWKKRGRSRTRSILSLFFANFSPHEIFHGQEQGRSRYGTGQEQGKSRGIAEKEQGRRKSRAGQKQELNHSPNAKFHPNPA